MSTIENLVIRIQNGEPDLMPELWENVHRFIAWRARQLLATTGNHGGAEVDDLVNSGYFALLDAVRTFRPGEYRFLTWLSVHLRNSFSEAAGFRTRAQKNDVLHYAVSLSTPLDHDSGDVLGDTLEDPEGVYGFEQVEQDIFTEQLRAELQRQIEKLPPMQAAAICRRYFDGHTYAEIGCLLDVSTSRAQQLEYEAIRKLQEPETRKRLEAFVEGRTPYFLQTGPEAFQRTHTSAVEAIVFLRERLRRYGERKITEEHKWM